MESTTNSLLGTEETPLVAPTSDERTLAILSHVLTIISGFIAPLIIYILKNNDSKFVGDHAKESLNFQITMMIGYLIAFVLMIVIIGVFLVAILGIIQLVLVIVATIRASEGKLYRYPFCIRLVK